jgi:hypothetical protein
MLAPKGEMGSINSLGDPAFAGLSDSSFAASATRVQPVSQIEDQVQLATIPFMAQAEQQFQDKNPPNLQAVLGDAIRNLRAAALQSTNPVEAAYLSGLADRFQRLEDTGSAGAQSNSLQSPSS